MDATVTRSKWRIEAASVPFFIAHAVAIAGIVWLGWSWTGLALAIGLYYLRMFFVCSGYHRYFSHRTFKTSRPFQFFLAFMAQTSAQKGILWWAARHRHHHKYSDTPLDHHSAKQDGFWYSHVGWFLADNFREEDLARVGDLAKYPELRLLERFHTTPAVIFAVVTYLLGGTWGLLWGFFVSTVLLWHGTFLINSLAHVIGKKRYESGDESKNSFVLAVLTMGEGWHNNHHHYQSSVRQGFFWWELDMSYLILKVLAFFGLVWDLRDPPPHLLAPHPVGVRPEPAGPPAESVAN